MDSLPLGTLVSSAGLTVILFLPLMAIQFVTLIAIPSIRSGSRPADVGRSILGYSAQTVGILLMTAGGLPTFYTVLASQPLTSGTYTALLFIFAIGGLVYLWHDAMLRTIDASARAVPQMIFAVAWKFVGLLITLFVLLSVLLRLALDAGGLTPGWWILHLTFLLYGLLLTCADLGQAHGGGFRSQVMAGAKMIRRKK